MASLEDIKNLIGTKRTFLSANSETFSKFSCKKDVYDFLKNHL